LFIKASEFIQKPFLLQPTTTLSRAKNYVPNSEYFCHLSLATCAINIINFIQAMLLSFQGVSLEQ